MNPNLIITTNPHTGRRVNATPESDIPEEVKLELAAAQKAERNHNRSRTLAIWSAVFLWMPFAAPLVYFFHGWMSGSSMPLVMYPTLVLTFRLFSNVGSLLLYLTARAVNTLRKIVGWFAFALFILPVVTLALMGPALFTFDFEFVPKIAGIFALVTLALTLFSMAALNGFSVLLVKRIFPRQHGAQPND